MLPLARWSPPKPMGWRRHNLLLGKTAGYHSASWVLTTPHTFLLTIHFQKCSFPFIYLFTLFYFLNAFLFNRATIPSTS